jgi:hypothetical protein
MTAREGAYFKSGDVAKLTEHFKVGPGSATDLQDTANPPDAPCNNMAQNVPTAAIPPVVGLIGEHLAKRLIIHAPRLCALM